QFLVMPDDFGYDEGQEFLGEYRVKLCLFGKFFQAFDLTRLAGGVGWGKVVPGLEPANRLRVLEPLGQRKDEDRVQPVNRLAMLFQKLGGAGDGIAHPGSPVAVCRAVTGRGWRQIVIGLPKISSSRSG